MIVVGDGRWGIGVLENRVGGEVRICLLQNNLENWKRLYLLKQ